MIFLNNRDPIVSEKLKSKAANRDIPIPEKLVKCLQTVEKKSEFVIYNTLGNEYNYTSFYNMWLLVKRRKVKNGEEAGASPGNRPN